MKERCYIIPGFGEQISPKLIKKLDSALGHKIEIIPIYIKWTYTSITGWIKQTEKKITETTKPIDLLIGFSFGAIVAAILSQEYKPKHLILCSPSPYFAENLPDLPDLAEKMLGKRRMKDFSKYSISQLELPSDTRILIAEKDFYLIPAHAENILSKVKGERTPIIVVPDAPHDIAHPSYEEALITTAVSLYKKSATI